MRRITGLWFGGMSGPPDYTSIRMENLLHDRLDDALVILSGLQQGVTGQQYDDGMKELDDCVADIIAGLTGQNFTLTDALPYPGEWDLKEE